MQDVEIERNEALLRQALAIARRHKLPVTARSLTQKEYAAAARREWGCVLGGGAILLVLLPFWMAFDGSEDGSGLDLAIRTGPWLFGLALLLWLASLVMKWRAGKSYADPGIRVEIWDEGVTITSPGQRHTLGYADLAPELRNIGITSPRYFGITLPSPIGPLALDNIGYKGGRTAGAVIVGRCVAAGALPAPERDNGAK